MEILTVNYNTPDLIDRLIQSIRNSGYNNVIRIIDGSDREETMRLMKTICNQPNVILQQVGYNIHHGRGLHLGISSSTSDWILCVDSEVQILPGMFEVFTYSKAYEGFPCYVNQFGYNGGEILYLHPELLLVDARKYKAQSWKFIHHGAPAIQVMTQCPDNEKSCLPDEFKKFYIRGGRGTVSRFGYNL